MIRFFLLTFALSWSCFLGATRLDGVSQSAVLFLGTVAPAIVALSLIRLENRRGGLQHFFTRHFTWASSPRWYFFAIWYFIVIKLTAAIVHRLVAGAWPRFGTESLFLIAIAVVFSTPVQAGEEIALFLPGADKLGQSFIVYLIGTTTLSVAIAWLYAHTNASLWMTMLMHSAVNQTTGIVPTSVPGATDVFALSHSLIAWLTVALMGASAVYFLVRMPALPDDAR